MNPSDQQFPQPNIPKPGAGIPHQRMSRPGPGSRPGIPRPGFPTQTGPKPLTPTNIPETTHAIESPFSAEPHREESVEPTSGIINPEENQPQSAVDTDEEPEIKLKKKHFEPKNFEERENNNEDEEPKTADQATDNYVSLTESLKAMQSLRNNFMSFGEAFGTPGDDAGTPERTYRETDEEDYVKVESAEELPSKDFDDEHYDEDTYSPEHQGHSRVMRDNYIEEIHEELHEESRREDDDEEEDVDHHEKEENNNRERGQYLEDQDEEHPSNATHEEITHQNISHDNDPRKSDEYQIEDPEGVSAKSSAKHRKEHEFLEKSDPEDNGHESASKVMFIPHSNSAQYIHPIEDKSAGLTSSAQLRDEKNKFLDDFEYGEEPQIKTEPIHEEKPKDITPPISPQKIQTQEEQVEEELPPPKSAAKVITHDQDQDPEELPPPKSAAKVITEDQDPEELPPPKSATKVITQDQDQDPEELPPPKSAAKVITQDQDPEELPPPKSAAKVINEEEEVPPSIYKQEEEEEVLPPPKVLYIPQSAGSVKPKTASSPFGISKPASAQLRTPFVNVNQSTSSFKVPESAERKIATPLVEPDFGAEEDLSVPEGDEISLLVRLKKAEIELRKEKLKNEKVQSEKDNLLTENQNLKSEVTDIKTKLQVLEKSRDAERLAQKEQETIEKLKAELKSTIEGSRLVNEHSNRIINESTKYKQDIESFINTLEEEKKELQQTIINLKTQIHQETLKNETLTQKIDFLEQKAQEYEASFDLIQRRTKDRAQAFEKLTALSENAKSTLESLPKVEDLLSKIQPIPEVAETIDIQTSTSQLTVPKDQGLQVYLEPKSSAEPSFTQKSGVLPAKPLNPFHLQKAAEKPQKSMDLHIEPPARQSKTLDLPLQPKTGSSLKAEQTAKAIIENVKKSHDFDDDLNLLLENESPIGKLHPPQSSDKKGSANKLGGRRIEESPTIFEKKENEKEKEIERENEKEEDSLSTILHNKNAPAKPLVIGNMKKTPSKKEPTVSFSQNIPSLSKQKDDLASKKQSAGIKPSQWDMEFNDENVESLKGSVQLSESDLKDKTEDSAPPKFATPQSKPVIPNFALNKTATEETKKKSKPLIINKIATNEQEKPATTTTTSKPKTINFGNINLGKSGSRYTQPKKGLGSNVVADEADSFFDDLGVSDTPSKGGNTLRESVTSLRSSTANQFV